jgi:hypothetical protein
MLVLELSILEDPPFMINPYGEARLFIVIRTLPFCLYLCSGLEALSIVLLLDAITRLRSNTTSHPGVNKMCLLPLRSDGNVRIVPVRQGNVLKRRGVVDMITNNSLPHPHYPRSWKFKVAAE